MSSSSVSCPLLLEFSRELEATELSNFCLSEVIGGLLITSGDFANSDLVLFLKSNISVYVAP